MTAETVFQIQYLASLFLSDIIVVMDAVLNILFCSAASVCIHVCDCSSAANSASFFSSREGSLQNLG